MQPDPGSENGNSGFPKPRTITEANWPSSGTGTDSSDFGSNHQFFIFFIFLLFNYEMINILLKIALYDYWEGQTDCLPLQPGARRLGQHSLKLDIYWVYFILFFKPQNWTVRVFQTQGPEPNRAGPITVRFGISEPLGRFNSDSSPVWFWIELNHGQGYIHVPCYSLSDNIRKTGN